MTTTSNGFRGFIFALAMVLAAAVGGCAAATPEEIASLEAEAAALDDSDSAAPGVVVAPAPSTGAANDVLCSITTPNGCSCSSPNGICVFYDHGTVASCEFTGKNGTRCATVCEDTGNSCECAPERITGAGANEDCQGGVGGVT